MEKVPHQFPEALALCSTLILSEAMVKRRNAFMKSLQKRQIAVIGRAVLVVMLVGCWSAVAEGAKRTVCTITVNSADEKEAFHRHLRGDEYEFVELVEPGRVDWLASAC